MRPIYWTLAPLMLTSSLANADTTTTTVTTYVVKTQEERESTRWTLTEWLKIKERMRMMDVWLAMFSDPKKDNRFQPELMLNYDMTRGNFKYNAGAGQANSGALSGEEGKAQLWLTNLISGTVGWRTLNIDFGLEGSKRTAGGFTATQPTDAAVATTAPAGSAAATGSTTASSATTTAATRSLDATYYTGDLRIFGKNIQDSSLVLKYGQYTAHNGILDSLGGESQVTTTGALAGADLQLYLLKFLGAEGNYLRYGDTAGVKGSSSLSGNYYDYMGFVEISLLRLQGGLYAEDWTTSRLGQPVTTQEKGTIAGLKLQF